jgi:uncharacterized iron-regulated protein
MTCTRRTWLACAAVAPLGACATSPAGPVDRIVDTRTGQDITADEVERRMRHADIVLLGELHDNPHHHARRAALLARMAGPVSVVAEHLPQGEAPTLATDLAGESLRGALEASGFDAKGWRWPMHEPLFRAVARAGMALRGGNLGRDAARRVAREGPQALPAELARGIEAAPLDAAARTALEQELLQGHCGHLSAARLPGMVAAQRGRDAAMAEALLSAAGPTLAAPGARRAVLLAGNGHVRLDHGVPTLLAKQWPDARVLTIGFLETPLDSPPGRLPYDIAWATPATDRDDPCQAFPAARAAST